MKNSLWTGRNLEHDRLVWEDPPADGQTGKGGEDSSYSKGVYRQMLLMCLLSCKVFIHKLNSTVLNDILLLTTAVFKSLSVTFNS